jgi:hypothetical protein
VANARESGTVSILLGHGDGTFDPPRAFAVGRVPVSVAAGDFNGDGLWDLAVANASPSVLVPGPVSILLGKGDGTFSPADNVPAGVSPQSVVVADFNGDGLSERERYEGAAAIHHPGGVHRLRRRAVHHHPRPDARPVVRCAGAECFKRQRAGQEISGGPVGDALPPWGSKVSWSS